MSRIGNQPIPVPSGVSVKIDNQHVSVKGSKGELELDVLENIEVVLEDGVISLKNRVESRKINAFRGLTRSLINNMIVGVDKGFQKNLLIEGVGYKASTSGNELTLNVGYSNPVSFTIPKGVNAAVDGNKITLEAIDKDLLGLTAAKIRQIRKPEPYKGKGIKFVGEVLRRKAGKAASK